MDDLGKLAHLVEHWGEHNAGHSESYREWAKKAEAAGRGDIAAILEELASGTLALNELLRRASDLLKK